MSLTDKQIWNDIGYMQLNLSNQLYFRNNLTGLWITWLRVKLNDGNKYSDQDHKIGKRMMFFFWWLLFNAIYSMYLQYANITNLDFT